MAGHDQFLDELKQKVAAVDHALKQFWPAHLPVPQVLADSMRYSLEAGGKRMRPVLLLSAAEACGAGTDAAYPVACAVEWIHTYSLIHDDLPAMDDDHLRRGKPTNHIVFGEAVAILAGDGLLTHAFALCTEALVRGADPLTVVRVVRELSEAAGPGGMVGGQILDIASEQGLTGLEQLETIHRHKTGDLIVFCLRAGGLLGGATPAQLEALTGFGRDIGLAFQILDDVLDETGDETKLGKPVKSDQKLAKATYPYLMGLEAAKEKVRYLTERAKRSVREAGLADPEKLCALADYLLHRDH